MTPAEALDRTIAARTARVRFAHGPDPVPTDVDWLSEGVTDFKARRTLVRQLALTPRDMAELGSAMPDAEAWNPRDPITPAAVGTPTLYDGMSVFVGDGTRWAEFEPNPGPDGPRHQNDPVWPLDALHGAGSDVERIGDDEVAGDPVVHHRLLLDLDAADHRLPFGIASPSGPFRELREMPCELWLDTGGRVRRISTAHPSDPRNSIRKRTWLVTELWDFGVDVTIDPPRREELVAPTDLDWEAMQRNFADRFGR